LSRSGFRANCALWPGSLAASGSGRSRALSGLAADVRSRMRSASRQRISTTGSGSGKVGAESHTLNGGEDTQLWPVKASRRHREKRGRPRQVSCPVTHSASCCSSSTSSNQHLRSISSYSPKSIRSRPWLRGCRCRRRGGPPSHLRRMSRRSLCRGSESSILRVPSTSSSCWFGWPSTGPRLRNGSWCRALPTARGPRPSLPQSGRIEAHLTCAESGYRARPGKATAGADSCAGISALLGLLHEVAHGIRRLLVRILGFLARRARRLRARQDAAHRVLGLRPYRRCRPK